MVKPRTVVKHEAQKILLRSFCGIRGATDAAAVFASEVAGKRESQLVQKFFGIVVVLDLNTVVGVVTHAARSTECIFAQHVLVAEDRYPSIRPPQNLEAQPRPVVEAAVRLPTIHEPRFDF